MTPTISWRRVCEQMAAGGCAVESGRRRPSAKPLPSRRAPSSASPSIPRLLGLSSDSFLSALNILLDHCLPLSPLHSPPEQMDHVCRHHCLASCSLLDLHTHCRRVLLSPQPPVTTSFQTKLLPRPQTSRIPPGLQATLPTPSPLPAMSLCTLSTWQTDSVSRWAPNVPSAPPPSASLRDARLGWALAAPATHLPSYTGHDRAASWSVTNVTANGSSPSPSLPGRPALCRALHSHHHLGACQPSRTAGDLATTSQGPGLSN